MTRQNLTSLGWQLVTFLAGVAITWIFLSIPTPRQFGLAFRYDFLPVIAPLALLIFLILQLPDRLSRFFLFGLVSAIMVLPVAGLWASGQSEQYLLGGIIPFSDARSYFTDSRRLAEGSPFYTGASRRPLFTAMLTSLQWITGQNLYITIAILTMILGVTLFFAVQELKSHEGKVTAAIFLVFLFCYSRMLLGKTLSEFLGLPGGLLAFVFLLRGVAKKQLKYLTIGLIMLSLALNARAGAFIILPMIALWVGWYFRQTRFFHWKSFLVACAAILIGFAVNTISFRMYSSEKSVPFGNFSYTIYGLARGGYGWTQIFTDHPETWNMPADEQAPYVYSLTLDVIKRKPMNLVTGIIRSYQEFFSLDDYYGSIGWFGGQGTTGNIARVGFYILLVIGLFFCIKDFKIPLRSFFLFAFLGICLSIPFAPPIDSNRMRVYAATMPFFTAIPAIGLASLCGYLPWKFLKSRELPEQSLTPVNGLGIALLLLMTVIPIIPFHLTPVEAAPVLQCSNELKQVSFRILPGNHLRIIDQDSAPQDWVPLIRNKTFATRVHNLPNWETYPLFTEVKPGQVILVDLDLQISEPMILIADWDEVSGTSGVQTVCGRPSDEYMLREYNVYFAEEYLPR
jgi:hypothetical protein